MHVYSREKSDKKVGVRGFDTALNCTIDIQFNNSGVFSPFTKYKLVTCLLFSRKPPCCAHFRLGKQSERLSRRLVSLYSFMQFLKEYNDCASLALQERLFHG